MEREELDI